MNKKCGCSTFLLILNHLESNTAALSLDLWMNAVILTSLVSQLCCELVRGRFAADVHEATCEQHACVTWYRLAIIDPNDSLLPLASLMAELVFFHSRPQAWSCCCCCCIRSQFSEMPILWNMQTIGWLAMWKHKEILTRMLFFFSFIFLKLSSHKVQVVFFLLLCMQGKHLWRHFRSGLGAPSISCFHLVGDV